ncbi:hypothetical protein EH243_14410 [Amphritea opalescens]|uniref:FlgO domain-containing protein n=1 Tax=Amphritea opalescens TaxID=2490544 RepID=A0A430KNK6_9GAMM|nr:FlgO family outer membrane protein [Amphritea opalescens]RTE65052.1 hypothetical protein EH243_14410 [Amphritea opalescens]
MRDTKRKTSYKLVLALLSAVALAGCASHSSVPKDPTVNLIQISSSAAKSLASGLTLDEGKPVLAVSFANIDNLRSSSTLGRTLGEQFSSAMTNLGVPMVEIKMRSSLFVEAQTGELILSRQLRSIVNSHDAQAVVLGTYAVGGNNIYVTAKVVRTADNLVLSSTNYTLPLNKDISAMIRNSR